VLETGGVTHLVAHEGVVACLHWDHGGGKVPDSQGPPVERDDHLRLARHWVGDGHLPRMGDNERAVEAGEGVEAGVGGAKARRTRAAPACRGSCQPPGP
jgi:hypothetical protein